TGPIRGTLPDISRQLDLMREVVVDDPLVPVELKPIDIEAQPGKQAGGVSRAWRSGVEGHPAGTRKVRFHPTVRVAGADDVVAGEVVVFAREESVDFAGGNANCAQHDGHRGSEVLAVARAGLEEEMSQGIVAGFALQDQRVSEIVAQVAFHGQRFVERIARGCGDAPGEFRNAWIECVWKLEVSVENLPGIDGAGGAGPHWPRLRQNRNAVVA